MGRPRWRGRARHTGAGRTQRKSRIAGGASRCSPLEVLPAGPLAHLAEQRTFNPRVVGSRPTGPTKAAGQRRPEPRPADPGDGHARSMPGNAGPHVAANRTEPAPRGRVPIGRLAGRVGHGLGHLPRRGHAVHAGARATQVAAEAGVTWDGPERSQVTAGEAWTQDLRQRLVVHRSRPGICVESPARTKWRRTAGRLAMSGR